VQKRPHFACLREAASAKAGRAGTNDENIAKNELHEW
jgi:hypothetical protein